MNEKLKYYIEICDKREGRDYIIKSKWYDPFCSIEKREYSYDFCFDGIEQGSIVAVLTYYREAYNKFKGE